MNSPRHPPSALLLGGLILLVIHASALAGSATWSSTPTNSDWDTASNWTPQTVPDESTDVATFDFSTVTDISVATDLVEVDSIVFTPAASAYTITISENNPLGYLSLYGSGVINNSGLTQNFSFFGNLYFAGTASAGTNVVYTNQDKGDPFYFDIGFADQATAGSATFVNTGSSGVGFYSGAIVFFNTATAGDATIINEDGNSSGGGAAFFDSSTAGDSTITSYGNGHCVFFDFSTAGTATLVGVGAQIRFEASTDGQMARVELSDDGLLDLAAHHGSAAMSIGSLEGDSTSTVRLGAIQLSVGGNGLSTTFDGLIVQEGSLLKTGKGKLTLTGANTYSGGTRIIAGTLVVQAATGSATGTGPVRVNGGTLGGTGTIAGAATVGTGSGRGAFLAPGVNGPGNLAISDLLTFKADGSYPCELNLGQAKADQISANGVTIETGAQFIFRSKGSKILSQGTTFTVINNTAATPISGTFANLADGSTLLAGSNTLQVSYEGGDGNDLTLTVAP